MVGIKILSRVLQGSRIPLELIVESNYTFRLPKKQAGAWLVDQLTDQLSHKQPTIISPDPSKKYAHWD